MKIWLDDIRKAPKGYAWCHSVNEAKHVIETSQEEVEFIDCDHDLGDYASDGGDGIKLLDYLVENENFIPIRLHTANIVGRMNMIRTINRYWR